MKALWHPFTIIAASFAVVGVAIGSIPLLVGSVALWIGAVAFVASREAQLRAVHQDVDSLSPDARILFRPIKKLHEELAEVVISNPQNPTVKVIGEEALAESEKILEQSYRLAAARGALQKALKGRTKTQMEIRQVEEQLREAQSEHERDALRSAVEAHQMESQHFISVEQNIEKIDSRMRQAQASLSELKTRIAVGAANAIPASEHEDLEELVSRLKALGKSFEESSELTQDVTR